VIGEKNMMRNSIHLSLSPGKARRKHFSGAAAGMEFALVHGQ
jgi:hypothetical protein